jgi:hypothetical protein
VKIFKKKKFLLKYFRYPSNWQRKLNIEIQTHRLNSKVIRQPRYHANKIVDVDETIAIITKIFCAYIAFDVTNFVNFTQKLRSASSRYHSLKKIKKENRIIMSDLKIIILIKKLTHHANTTFCLSCMTRQFIGWTTFAFVTIDGVN